MPPRTMIIVEDSAGIRERIRAHVDAIGNIRIVGEAEDVATAIDLIDRHQPDLVTLDIRLKDGGSGLRVLEHLRGREQQPQVVILSAAFDHQRIPESLAASLPPVLDKITEFHRLADQLRVAMAESQAAAAARGSGGQLA